MLTERDLTAEQRAWAPADEAEAATQWPVAHKTEYYDRELVFSPGAESWDWRSVALAARAYPGWTITLEDSGILTARPVVQPGSQLGAPAAH